MNKALQTPLIDPLRSGLAIDEQLIDEAKAFIQAGLEGAKNTQRAYSADINLWLRWCAENSIGFKPIAPGDFIKYTTFLARSRSYYTIQRHIASIAKFHRLLGFESPSVTEAFKVFIKGIKRTKTVKQKQAPGFTLKQLRDAVDAQPKTPTGLRNRALLLIGYTGAYRREELVAIDIEDIVIDEFGMTIQLKKSKTNQFGEADEKSFEPANEEEYCPILALQVWRTAQGTSSGPLFVRIRKGEQVTDQRLSDEWVYRLVQSSFGAGFTAHSLRSSFVTITKENGADDREIQNQTKHKTTTMIARYDRRRNVRKYNASRKAGL